MQKKRNDQAPREQLIWRVTELEEIIRSEIRAAGAISFARFMELALYHPEFGYYERRGKQTGREGDFYTSVSVGSLYGEFLGFDFADRLRRLTGNDLLLVEAGAHDGQLGLDLLNYLQVYQEGVFRRIEYVIIEPSSRRARKQFETLDAFRDKVRWVKDWSEVGEFQGICFSNELLDAMPVYVFRWSAVESRWMEWGVAEAHGRFVWQRLAANDANAQRLLARVPEDLLAVLPDGFAAEVCPSAVSWWMQAAHALRAGWLYTADYGLLQEDFFVPQRADGTLRAYVRHRGKSNVLDNCGEQDLTAHVNFSLVMAAGESAGLATGELVQQGIFLKTVLEQIERRPAEFPLWTPMRYRQLTSLIHPEHLGRAFKVLVQSRV